MSELKLKDYLQKLHAWITGNLDDWYLAHDERFLEAMLKLIDATENSDFDITQVKHSKSINGYKG